MICYAQRVIVRVLSSVNDCFRGTYPQTLHREYPAIYLHTVHNRHMPAYPVNLAMLN